MTDFKKKADIAQAKHLRNIFGTLAVMHLIPFLVAVIDDNDLQKTTLGIGTPTFLAAALNRKRKAERLLNEMSDTPSI